MARSKMSPDTALRISLIGNAQRLATEYAEMRPAVDELKAIADGRRDLLAEAAGHHLGTYLGTPAMTHPAIPYAAALLIMAGADEELVVPAADVTRGRAGKAYSL